jgi:hypothetical protein
MGIYPHQRQKAARHPYQQRVAVPMQARRHPRLSLLINHARASVPLLRLLRLQTLLVRPDF